jgi:hypothetical protein
MESDGGGGLRRGKTCEEREGGKKEEKLGILQSYQWEKETEKQNIAGKYTNMRGLSKGLGIKMGFANIECTVGADETERSFGPNCIHASLSLTKYFCFFTEFKHCKQSQRSKISVSIYNPCGNYSHRKNLLQSGSKSGI